MVQSVQNTVAHLITGVRWCEHIMPVLRQLHWLPVCRRVEFKISTLVYHSLAGTAPVYLADDDMMVTAGCCRPLRTVEYASSTDHAPSSVTAVLPPPVQRCEGTVYLNSFGNQTSASDNLNNCLKRLRLVSCAATPRLWTLRALYRNLAYLLLANASET